MTEALAGPTIQLPNRASARITSKPTLSVVTSTLPQYCGNSLLWRLTWRTKTRPEPSVLYWLSSETAQRHPRKFHIGWHQASGRAG